MSNSNFGGEATRAKVRWYQSVLRTVLGHNVPINGDHNDSRTRAALRAFSRKNDFKRQDGFLGADAGVAMTHVALQWIYRQHIPGRLGRMNNALRTNIRRFQQDCALVADGRVGQATREPMVAVLSGVTPRPESLFPPEPDKPGKLRESVAADQAALGVKAKAADRRKSQLNTQTVPSRWMCHLSVHFGNKMQKVAYRNNQPISVTPSRNDFIRKNQGTGVLISPRHVLTCAHNLRYHDDDNLTDGNPTDFYEAESVEVCPAYNGAFTPKKKKFPYGKHTTNTFHFPDAYEVKSNKIVVGFDTYLDFALIELDDPIADLRPTYKETFFVDGKRKQRTVKLPRLGYWGDRANYRTWAVPERHLVGKHDAHHIGYPSHKPPVKTKPNRRGMQWYARGEIDEYKWRDAANHDFARISSAMTSSRGHSGGPFWLETIDSGLKSTMIGIQHEGGWMIRSEPVQIPSAGPVWVPIKKNVSIAVVFTDDLFRILRDWVPDTFHYADGELTVHKLGG